MYKKFSLKSIEPGSMRNKHILKIICLFFAFFLVCHSFYAIDQEVDRNALITIKKANITMEEVLREIERQSGFLFIRDDDVDLNQQVSINVKNEPVEKILNRLFNGKGIEYRLKEKHILLSLRKQEEAISGNEQIVQQQKKRITGTVRDANGETVIGANVVEDGVPSNGTVTDQNGHFSLEITPGAVLKISYIGYNEQKVETKGKSSLDIVLLEDVKALDELVVVGYGIQKKVNLSGSVDAISAKSLDNRAISSVSQGLQGLSANLNITAKSGSPYDDLGINIRGFTTISGGNSIDDKKPISTGDMAGPLILIDNVPGDLRVLNPSDIESISVLKDAAASAIYGARGAFGVVLVTTKSAISQKLKVDANVIYGTKRIVDIMDGIIYDVYDVMYWKKKFAFPKYQANWPEAMMDYAKKRSEDPSLPEVIPDPLNPEKYLYFGTTNWFKEAYFDSSPTYTANVQLSQRTDKINYYFSSGFFQQDGIIRHGKDKYNRYNMTAKADLTVTPWLTLSNNTQATFIKEDKPIYDVDDNFFNRLGAMNTACIPKNPDGSWTWEGAIGIGRLEGTKSNAQKTTLRTTFNLDAEIIKNTLSVKTDFTYTNFNAYIREHFLRTPYRDGPNSEDKYWKGDSYAENGSHNSNTYIFNIYGDFHKKWNKHYLQSLVGFNQEYGSYKNFWAKKTNLISPSVPSISLATGSQNMDEKISEYALRGLFYRLNYIFNNKYIAEFNGRYDGSSRFPKDNRFDFFPSVSGAWVVSEEPFFATLQEKDISDFMKLRASYGSLGNQNTSNYYQPIMGVSINGNYLLGGVFPLNAGAPGLYSGGYTWETVTTLNGGIDLSFLKNRLNITGDIYRRETKNMLTKGKTLPSVLGTGEPKENAADLETKGWELSLNWRDGFDLVGSKFKYGLRFIIADSRTFITKFDNPTKYLWDYYEGMELGELWGFVNDGFFQTEEELMKIDQSAVASDDAGYYFAVGDLKYKDLNNDGKINWGNNTVDDPGDRKIIGNTSIRYPYSFMLDCEWKNFDLSIFFQGIGKRDYRPRDDFDFGLYSCPWTYLQKIHLDHWTPENRDAYYPRPKCYIAEDWNSELGMAQSKYLQDASYLRLKNLTLGYSLPVSVLHKIKLEKIRFFFTGENIAEISHLKTRRDPESPETALLKAYPFTRNYSFGVNIKF